jgi:hypothetical protein
MTPSLPSAPTRRSIAWAVLVPAAWAALHVFAAAAGAAPAGRWTQVTRAHNGAKANLGLARGKDATLHVLWAGPGRLPYTAIRDTPISPKGVLGRPRTVLSSWTGVHVPDAVAAPDGSIHALIGGQEKDTAGDPHAGINEAVGPGSWTLGARAFGNASITEASNADLRAAMLPSGKIVSVWQSGRSALMQVGVDPSTPPQSVQPAGRLVAAPVVAVDQANGAAVIAYHDASSGSDFFRQILPSLGAPASMPKSKADGPTIAARAGGGIYSAYSPDGASVVRLRFGGRSAPVPVPQATKVLSTGLAAGPDGRLWVFYGNDKTTFVTRTDKAVSGGFEPAYRLARMAL